MTNFILPDNLFYIQHFQLRIIIPLQINQERFISGILPGFIFQYKKIIVEKFKKLERDISCKEKLVLNYY